MSDKRPPVDHQHALLDFPDGDGKPDCPKCQGRGVVTVMVDMPGGVKWPGGTQPCDCVYERDLRANVKRLWPVLQNVTSVDKSPLLARTERSLWITASSYDFRRHLRYVAFRKKPSWNARVFADSALVTAWLSTTKEAFDPDVLLDRSRTPSNEFFTIVDLAVPYDLLILVLGVKAAKNREMPNVLMEAINEREIAGKPTWVVDSPAKPLQPGHICYNDSVMELLDGFERVIISTDVPTAPGIRQFGMQGTEVIPAGQSRAGSPYTKRKPGMESPQAAPAPRRTQAEPAPTRQTQREPEPAQVAPPRQQAGSPYTRRKPGVMARPAPIPQAERAPAPLDPRDFDDDDMSVDALMAHAADPKREEGLREGLMPEEESVDDVVSDIVNYQPTPEELGTAHVPSFLQRQREKAARGAKLREERDKELAGLAGVDMINTLDGVEMLGGDE